MTRFILICICFLSACGTADSGSLGDKPSSAKETTDSLAARGEDALASQLASLDQQLERSPDNWALFQDRSLLHYTRGDVQEAVNDIREAIKIYDDSPELHYLRGFYGMAQGDTSLALSEYQLAARYGSMSPDNYYQIGQIFFFRKNYDMAIASYRESARLDSTDPMYPFAMGFLEEARGNSRAALSSYEQALSLNPNHVKTLLQLHDLYLLAFKDEKKALAYNQQVLNQIPGHPLARYNQGNQHYRNALQLANSPDTLAYREEVNLAVEDYSVAIHNGQEGFAEPYFYRGHCYFQGNRLDLAMEDFQKAIAIDSLHAPAHFYLGSIYEFYQDPQTALQQYQKALAADPDFPGAKEAVRELGE